MKCCPRCGSKNIVDKSPNMWTNLHNCKDCGSWWEMRDRDGKRINSYGDLL